MSSLYNLEPQPTAKVLFQTTAGDILLELFAKQTPLTSRNFLQLCLDGYYNGTIFHRLVPGFIIQGGDPTGTGSGGESIYTEDAAKGGTFEDEFHSRLKFNRRGLLGMANESRKDSNGSQFFFTLGETPELNSRNTMFGRVVGDTIYNLMKMGEAELVEGEGSERPLYPTRVTGAEILVNPFEDMVKRDLKVQAATMLKRGKKKPAKRKVGKALLSFGVDEEGETVAPVVKKPKFNPKLVSGGEEAPEKLTNTPLPKAPERKPANLPAERPISVSSSPSPVSPFQETMASAHPIYNKPSRAPSSSPEPPAQVTKLANLIANTNAQIASMKASMRRTGPATAVVPEKPKSAIEAMTPATSTRGRKRRPGALSAAEERKTLEMLSTFKNKLESAPTKLVQEELLLGSATGHDGINGANGHTTAPSAIGPAGEDEEEARLCDLHFIANCQSCSKWDDEDANPDQAEDDTDANWMLHALSFAKDRLGKDLEWKRKNEEELVVIDPREKAKELAEERKEKRKGEHRLKDRRMAMSERGRGMAGGDGGGRK